MFTVSSKAIPQSLLKSNGRKHSQERQGTWDDEEMAFLWCSPRAGQELLPHEHPSSITESTWVTSRPC